MLGQIVYYRLDRGPNRGEYRPAVIVRGWYSGQVNLAVLCDGTNDGLDGPVQWVTERAEGTNPGQWRRRLPWMEPEPANGSEEPLVEG